MEIAICDDDMNFRKNIHDVLLWYKKKYRFEVNIYEYKSGNDLLDSQRVFDVVYMDYKMPGLNGLETARQLRKSNHICSIIFVTGYPEFILDSFTVQPFRFMIKPIAEEKIEEAMNAYVELQRVFYPISIVIDGELKTIATQDIIYLEGDGKYCWIYTKEGVYHSSKTLAETHHLLPPYCFFRIHKSYVINMFCIQSVKENIITLNDGTCIQVGRANLASFKMAYRDFLKNTFVRI